LAGLGLDLGTDALTGGTNSISSSLSTKWVQSLSGGNATYLVGAAHWASEPVEIIALKTVEKTSINSVASGSAANAAKGVTNAIPRTKDVLGHIFKNTAGHVNPATAASQSRYLNLFEKVANNSKNLNQSILKPSAIKNGVQGYTQTFRNGQQVRVHSRNGRIFDAGVNLIPR